MKKILAAATIIFALLCFYAVASSKFNSWANNKTPAGLQNKYAAAGWDITKVRVMIIPGHDSVTVGDVYGNLTEADMNAELGADLAGFLQKDSRLDVILSRDKEHYLPVLAQYFSDNWNAIESFMASHKNIMDSQISNGSVTEVGGESHTNVTSDAILEKLYGLNKWANENGTDITLNIHFNDYPRPNNNKPGKWSGFVTYVPDGQYSNGTTGLALGQHIFSRLKQFYAASNQPQESAGLLTDQGLIALGANNTLNAAAELTEYGYMYEPQFQNVKIRSAVLKDMAYQTYLGVEDFLSGASTSTEPQISSGILPYDWKTNFSQSGAPSEPTLALQAALSVGGFYPPAGSKNHSCSLNGIFGSCTATALSAFQNKYGIAGETGTVGDKTREKLNELYGAN